jgi:Tfp pilus assembly protein PilN
MDETRGAVRFSGQSNSLAAVADFISSLQTSGWFPTVELVSSKEQNALVTFVLQGNFVDPEVAAKQKAAAEAAAAAGPPPGAQRQRGRRR